MTLFFLLIAEITLLLTLCGFGPMIWLGPGIVKTGIAQLSICWALGICMLGTMATFVFYLEWPPISVVISALCVSAVTTLIATFRFRVNPFQLFLGQIASARRDLDLLICTLACLAVIFAAGYRKSFVQPLQLGIDEVGYSTTADFFVRGGTGTSVADSILKETAQPNLNYALNAHITALSFNTVVASEFLLLAHRFAYPLLIAGTTTAFHLAPLADYQFCILSVPLLCATLLIAWISHDLVGLPRLVSNGIGIAYCLNCNQLEVLYEGQYAQVFVLPLFALFFGIVYSQRHIPEIPESRFYTPQSFLLLAFTGAGVFALYSDSFIALGAFGAVLLFWDAVSLDAKSFVKTALVGSSVLFGMFCLQPYCFEWFKFIVRHLNNVGSGNGGFWQPHWAFPSEVAGYFSMYGKVVPQIVQRSLQNLLGNALISVALFLVLFTSGFLRSRTVARFWISPLLVCTLVYLHLRVYHDYINYQYFKVYTMLLAPLLILHFGSVFSWCRRVTLRSPSPEGFAILIAMIALAFPVLIGIRDCVSFNATSTSLSTDIRILREQSQTLGIDRYAIVTYPPGGLETAMLAAYIPFNCLNLGWADVKLTPHLGKEIVVLFFDKENLDYGKLEREGKLLFRGEHLNIVRTGHKISEFVEYDTKVVAVHFGETASWPHRQIPAFAHFIDQYLVLNKGTP